MKWTHLPQTMRPNVDIAEICMLPQMWSATLKEGGYTFGAWVLSLGLFVTPTVLIYALEQCLLNTMRQGWFAARGA